MTDGPLKNLKSRNRRWRQFADAIQTDAPSPQECGVIAASALGHDLITTEHTELMRALDAHLGCGKLDFYPLGSIDSIFDGCNKTPFLDDLQKELLCRVDNGMPLNDAIKPALDTVISSQIGKARSYHHEEIIRLQEAGQIDQSAAERALGKINSAFESVEVPNIRENLLASKKGNVYKDNTRNVNVDEGFVKL